MRWVSRGLMTLGLAGFLSVSTLLNPHFPPTSHQVSSQPRVLHFPVPPAIAQRVSNRRVLAQQVHDRLPDLPLENHYIHEETGDADTSNTLAHRLMQYHHGVKFRPLTSRFDWKLTLADYMGENEWMDAEQYPARWLESNPYETDVAIIQRLNRQQREILIQTLIDVLSSE